VAPPRAAILVTGNEVLRGLIVERNAGILTRSLDARAVRLERVVIVGDEREALHDALDELLASGVDLVVTSGGLGPTHDDLTMEVVAEVTGRPLAVDPEALEVVVAHSLRRRAIDAATREAVARKQAALPQGSRPLLPIGTASGAVVPHRDAFVVVLPGPPWELEAMWEVALETPEVAALLARVPAADRRLLRLYGVVESEFVQAFDALDPATRAQAEVGVCARAGELEVSVRAPAGTGAVLAVEAGLVGAFGDAVYSRDGRPADEVAAEALLAHGWTLAVAESCTGGLLGARLTARAGASAWFRGGVVAYDNAVKQDVLGVPEEVLLRHGAVSSECAVAMAEGARRLVGADWALSVTGVAGPGGGTPEKPVGLVYLGVAGPWGAEALEDRFRGDRERIRERAVAIALHLLRRTLAAAPAETARIAAL
jgi:nicotinamide-nucleotide amidase